MTEEAKVEVPGHLGMHIGYFVKREAGDGHFVWMEKALCGAELVDSDPRLDRYNAKLAIESGNPERVCVTCRARSS